MIRTYAQDVGTTTWPELLTVDEAAKVLETNVHAVLSAVDAGWVSALRLGPYVRIPRRELAAISPPGQ